MDLQNEYLPANHQDAGNEPIPTDDKYTPRLGKPCLEHRLAFPSNNKRLYPELTNIPVYQCYICSWFCYEGGK